MNITYALARSAPLLRWEDECFLIEEWQLRKDQSALENLLLSHARMAFFWARKVSRDITEQEDLVAEGMLGLIKAVDMFDQKRSVRFSTYARWWVKNSVLTALSRSRSIVDLPVGSDVSHTQLIITGDDALDNLSCEKPTPEEHVMAQSAQITLKKHLADALGMLDRTDREVLINRCLAEPAMSIGELSTKLDLTPAKLRQIERRAITKLKYLLIERGTMTSRVH